MSDKPSETLAKKAYLSEATLSDQVELVPTRNGFGAGLVELGEESNDIVVLCADLADSTRAGMSLRRPTTPSTPLAERCVGSTSGTKKSASFSTCRPSIRTPPTMCPRTTGASITGNISGGCDRC